jgi:hypothetical protein
MRYTTPHQVTIEIVERQVAPAARYLGKFGNYDSECSAIGSSKLPP